MRQMVRMPEMVSDEVERQEHTNLVRRKGEELRLQAERIESLKKEVPGPGS